MPSEIGSTQECDMNDEEKSILVVDDDIDVLESIVAILEFETSHKIVSATSKSDVETLLQHTTPDMALLDIQLGLESGLDLIPILRSHAADMVCTMITAHRDVEYAVKAVKLGANEYLFKPIEPAILLNHIHEWLCRQDAERKSEKRAQEERKKSQNDALTGLPGREILDHHLAATLASSARSQESFAVLFLDLDHFKELNDALGHQAGDELLVSASQEMRSCLRDEEILSRHGGDEFIIILREGSTKEDAQRVAERLLGRIAGIPMKEGQKQPVTTSIGIAIYPQDGDDGTTLLHHADQAMYRAKNNGKNCLSF
jgi:diguanylate cyclase (GGDEF)-like protein